MQITFNDKTALELLRYARANNYDLQPGSFEAPSPDPHRYWTRRLVEDLDIFGVTPPYCSMVPSKGSRIASAAFSNTIYSNLPFGSTIALNDEVSFCCPELLFLEMGRGLSIARQALLGYELCGSYSLGIPTVFGVAPVTDAARLHGYLDRLDYVRGVKHARRASRFVLDGAWSPMEAILALMIILPADMGGYGMKGILLNERVEVTKPMASLVEKTSRVPDITLDGTPVGINYDGEGHFDLDALAEAAAACACNPDDVQLKWALENAKRELRDAYVDDRRRERDLWVQGKTVFTATKEDLYQHGALDRLMRQVLEAVQRTTGTRCGTQLAALGDPSLAARRHRLLMQLLP